MKKKFEHCEGCDDARKELCAKLQTCLAEGMAGKRGNKKPVKKGTYG